MAASWNGIGRENKYGLHRSPCDANQKFPWEKTLIEKTFKVDNKG